jgi:hypothetical protein
VRPFPELSVLVVVAVAAAVAQEIAAQAFFAQAHAAAVSSWSRPIYRQLSVDLHEAMMMQRQ